jgi:hypothetical protein
LDADLAICRLAHKQGSVFVETDDAEADADGRQDIFGIVKQGQDKSIREAEANGGLIDAGTGVGIGVCLCRLWGLCHLGWLFVLTPPRHEKVDD